MAKAKFLKSTVVAVLVAYSSAVTLPALAQSAPSNPGCKNTAAVALIGGIFGALIGGKDRASGAAIGAAISAIACMALDASSKQTQSSAEVMQQYQAQHDGQAPQTVSLMKYEGQGPTSVGRDSGKPVELVSTGALVVPEAQQQNSQFFEELQLYVPGEKDPKIVKKQIALTDGGGGFQQSFKFSLDKTFPQGQYAYRTKILAADNSVLGERVGKFQVI